MRLSRFRNRETPLRDPSLHPAGETKPGSKRTATPCALERGAPATARRLSLAFGVLIGFLFSFAVNAEPADALFRYATNAFNAGDYPQAAAAFAQAAALHPASGTLQNLGNAEWQSGRPGPAIVAWEQALWLDPLNQFARNNLRFARRTAQIESPDLNWSEVVSSWLPANWWAWVAGASLWIAVGLSTVPGMLRWRKAAWQQALAAFGLAIFLLSIPAHIGIDSRAKLGFILFKDVPLRLTATAEAQFITRLAAGEPVRIERAKGGYLLVRASHTSGWIRANEIKLICSLPGSIPSVDPEARTAVNL
ncbi:MAG TPA: SH3 domain-containing protein [Verrucomicrobiae bacterium]|nr:SH3 domain-containing protein [Verrucomicrobiae bacterium]